jgi:RNA polymerase sigma-70 factor (ECF subfamily)
MTRSPARHDIELARRVAEGDRGALEVLCERYADSLYAFIAHHADISLADIDDVWQETLMAAVSSLSSYRGDSGLFTWLCAIARHKLADFERRAGRTRSHEEPVSPADLALSIDTGLLPDGLLHQKAVQLAVVDALAALPDDYRVALVARYAEERTVEEVAARLGRSYKATESLLARARLAFRDAIRHPPHADGGRTARG